MRSQQRYTTLKWVTAALLLIHLLSRAIFPAPNILIDLVLFNLVGLLAAVIAYSAPVLTDRISAITISLASLIWSTGSFLSTWNSFYNFQIPEVISDLCYSLFYPLIFFGIIRSFTYRRNISALELLDTVIITVGLAPTEPSGDGSESLRRADLAMYEAKRSKSGVMVWES